MYNTKGRTINDCGGGGLRQNRKKKFTRDVPAKIIFDQRMSKKEKKCPEEVKEKKFNHRDMIEGRSGPPPKKNSTVQTSEKEKKIFQPGTSSEIFFFSTGHILGKKI